MFSCELCEISKNTFFTEHVWATASGPWLEVVKLLIYPLSWTLSHFLNISSRTAEQCVCPKLTAKAPKTTSMTHFWRSWWQTPNTFHVLLLRPNYRLRTSKCLMSKGSACAEFIPALRSISKHVIFWGYSTGAILTEHDHKVFSKHQNCLYPTYQC